MEQKKVELEKHYELAIVGCGPAGMAAAINAKIRNRHFVLLGQEFCSPKLAKAERVDNFIGFPEIKGEELRQRFLAHLKQMQIEIIPWKVASIYPGPPFMLSNNVDFIQADAVILATGVSAQRLFQGEAELLGKGVGYCATCDGPLYKDKTVAIIAYEKEAEDEANYMADIGAEVYYIPYYKDWGKLDSRIKVKQDRVRSINGADRVEELVLTKETLKVDGVFILRENIPAEQLVPGLEMENGVIKVNHNLETNIPGLFAAGDCTGQPYQLLKATGEGATAALIAIKYLDGIKNNA
ncbi:MAG: FAD-dependent oxidoreductase [Peptococcaceae bacterium]|jgi:thioredoxin reductase (NADPH)|nr:FAD-dependent oxidoreductase [Peptococcaceae bacterium]